MGMQVKLVMFGAEGDRKSFNLSRDMTVIGRREDCDLRIPIGDVSRKHCRLVKDDSIVRIEDLGSSNGTYRNGERVQEATLEAGDSVKIGPVYFVVQIDGVPADDEITKPSRAIKKDETTTSIEDIDELSGDEIETVEDAEEASGEAVEDFDPMSALSGSDSGLNIEGTPGMGEAAGDSMQIPVEGEDEDK